jgi:cell division protein FtsL
MIRLATLIWIAILSSMTLGLFQVKYAVQELEEDLKSANREILEHQEALHVLRAEWSYLNQPTRIAQLARQHLQLAPMAPDRIALIDELPMRPLPAVVAEPDAEVAPGQPLPPRKPALRSPAPAVAPQGGEITLASGEGG